MSPTERRAVPAVVLTDGPAPVRVLLLKSVFLLLDLHVQDVCHGCHLLPVNSVVATLVPLGLSCRSLVTQDFLDYCCGVGGYVGLGGDGLTGDLDGDLA